MTNTSKSAVLVTGGAGYIGSHMAHALVDRRERVVVLDNLTTGVRAQKKLPPRATHPAGCGPSLSTVYTLVTFHGVIIPDT